VPGSTASIPSPPPAQSGTGSGVTSTTSALGGQSAGSEPVLTWTGLAGVRLGARAPEYAIALGHELEALDATDRQLLADHRCVIRALDGVPGLALMVIGTDADGPVRVIGLTRGSRIMTSAGIGVGDSLDDARRAFDAFLLDHPFDFHPTDGHAFTARAGDGARWVFIADSRNRLVEIRLGSDPEVYNPEGCV
jgi:hypothetical protein